MRVPALLAALSSTAACLGSQATSCPAGHLCPADLSCAPEPTYCASEEELLQCASTDRDGATCTSSGFGEGFCANNVCTPCTADRVVCSSPTWRQMMSPTTEILDALWVAGPSDVYAVGRGGTLLHYDGVAWTPETITVDGMPVTQTLRGIWGTPDGELFVAAQTGAVLHKTTTWQRDPGAPIDAHAVWGTSATNVFAVVNAERKVYRYTGTWSSVDIAEAPMFGIAGRTDTDVYAVGNGAIRRFDGTAWQLEDAPSGIAWRAVWADPAGPAYAVGVRTADGTAVIARTDGTAPWTEMPLPALPATPAPTTLYAIAGTGAGEVFAAGSNGVVLRLDGSTWTIEPTDVTVELRELAGTSSGDMFAVGTAGTILRYRRP